MNDQQKSFINQQEEIRYIQGMQNGDREIFKELFAKYYSHLCHFANLPIKNKEISEDVVQNLFVDLWDKREQLHLHTSLKGYLFTAIRRRSIRAINYHKRMVSEDAIANTLPIDHVTPEKKMENDEFNRLIMSELPEKLRTVFQMKYIDVMKQKEIAGMLKISENSVEKILSKARKQLKKVATQFLNTLLALISLFF